MMECGLGPLKEGEDEEIVSTAGVQIDELIEPMRARRGSATAAALAMLLT